MGQRVTVDIAHAGPAKFAKLCLEVFTKLGYRLASEADDDVSAEPTEFLVSKPDGEWALVRCVYRPKSHVGGPTVKKLEDELWGRATSGIVVTNTRFSGPAVKAASTSFPPVHLIDRALLAEMASGAGIDLLLDGRPLNTWTYDVSDASALEKSLEIYLDQRYRSRPRSVSELLRIEGRRINLLPAFQVLFDLKLRASRGGAVLYDESVRDGVVWISPDERSKITPAQAAFFESVPIKRYSTEAFREIPVSLPGFKMSIAKVREAASDEIRTQFTRSVTRLDGKSRLWFGTITPSDRRIQITDVRRVYLPISETRIRLLETTYELRFLDHPIGLFHPLNDSLKRCRICDRVVKRRAQLCNACGAGTHAKGLFRSHGDECSQCRRTLCRNCASYERRLVRKVAFCPDCKDSERVAP